MTTDQIAIDRMSRAEVAVLGEWAAAEGWNPGRADLDIAWEFDPDAFIALRKDGELIGGGSIFSYGGDYGFMGLFIMRPEFRGAGLGGRLWWRRLELMRQRLKPGAPIGMDGVFDMAPFYGRGGFNLAWRDFRFQGQAIGEEDSSLRVIDEALYPEVDAYDRAVSPAARTAFLRRWVLQPGGHALAAEKNGVLTGFAVARPALVGFKLGPVFADDAETAEKLARGLLARIGPQQVQLDVPEVNEAAMALAQRLGLTNVFGCARMYFGAAPKLPTERIFGVASFEFG